MWVVRWPVVSLPGLVLDLYQLFQNLLYAFPSAPIVLLRFCQQGSGGSWYGLCSAQRFLVQVLTLGVVVTVTVATAGVVVAAAVVAVVVAAIVVIVAAIVVVIVVVVAAIVIAVAAAASTYACPYPRIVRIRLQVSTRVCNHFFALVQFRSG